MPDHADTPVARPASRLAARLLADGFFFEPLGRPQGLGDRRLHRVELVVAGHLLGQRSAAVILEDDEVSDQRKKASQSADAFQHHLQLRHMRIGQFLAADRAPGLEPFPPAG